MLTLDVWLRDGPDRKILAAPCSTTCTTDGCCLVDPAPPGTKRWQTIYGRQHTAGERRCCDFIIVRRGFLTVPLSPRVFVGFCRMWMGPCAPASSSKACRTARAALILPISLRVRKTAVIDALTSHIWRRHCLANSSGLGSSAFTALLRNTRKMVFGGAACLSTHWIGIHASATTLPAAAAAALQRPRPRQRACLWMDHRRVRDLRRPLTIRRSPVSNAAACREKALRQPRFRQQRFYAGTGHHRERPPARTSGCRRCSGSARQGMRSTQHPRVPPQQSDALRVVGTALPIRRINATNSAGPAPRRAGTLGLKRQAFCGAACSSSTSLPRGRDRGIERNIIGAQSRRC